MRRYAEYVVRYRIIVLLAVALLTVALGTHLRDLRIVVDPDEILPQSHPLQIATNAVSRIFGNKYVIVVSITARAGTVFQPAILGRIKGLTDALMTTEGVIRSTVLSLASGRVKAINGSADGLDVQRMMSDVPTTEAGIAALEANFEANPVYHGLLVSNDHRTAAVIAEFRKDPAGFRVVAERVRTLVEPLRGPEVEIHYAGEAILVGLIEVFNDRMPVLFVIGMVIIGLLHWEAFRSLQAMILPLVTAMLAVVWSLGVLSWSGTTLDAFNVMTPILILAVAAGHAVQILKRYYERYATLRHSGLQRHAAGRQAVIDSIVGVGPIMIAASTIAGVSFLSLVASSVHSIQVFGIFTALGILSTAVIELTFTPALRASLRPPSEAMTARENSESRWDRFANRLAKLVTARPKAVLATAGVIAAALAAAASFVRADNATSAYFFPSLPALVDNREVNRLLAGTNTLYVLVEGGHDDAIKDPAVLRAMAATQRFLENEPQIGKTVSIVDFLTRINQAFAGDDSAEAKLPESQELVAQYLLLYSMSGDPDDFDHYVDYPYKTAVVAAFIREENSAYLMDLNRRIAEFAAATYPPGVRVSVGGSVMEPVALNEVIVKDKLVNIVQIAVCVFVVAGLLFRSALAGLLVLVPLAATVIAIFGVMGLTGIPMQVVTATITSLAIGIGADYAIYFLYHLRDTMRETGNVAEAVRAAFASAGKAVIFVSTAVAGGYIAQIASWGFYIHIWFGLLTSMAMIVSAAGALTVLPALVMLIRPRFLGARRPERIATAMSLLVAAAVALVGAPAWAQAPSADEIMQKNFVVTRIGDSIADATFTLINADAQQRVRKTISKTKLAENAIDNTRLVRFLSPPDVRGTATLTAEHSEASDDLWIYLPALKKTRRLLASNKKDSYVGTDFSYGDMIGFKVAEWRHELVRQEKLSDVDDFVVASVPARPQVQEDSGYSKRLEWIRSDSFVTEKGEYYDTAGKLLKTIICTDLREVDPAKHRWQAMHLEARNMQTGHSTVILLENYKANQGLSADAFNVRELEREQ